MGLNSCDKKQLKWRGKNCSLNIYNGWDFKFQQLQNYKKKCIFIYIYDKWKIWAKDKLFQWLSWHIATTIRHDLLKLLTHHK